MRVVVWTEFYWPSIGGGELFTMHLMRGMRARGVEVTLVTGRLGDALPAVDEIDGVPVYRFPFRPALERRDLAALAGIGDEILALLRSLQPDLVHMTWMGPCGVVFRQLQAEYPLPTLITLGQHLQGDVSVRSLRGRLLRSAAWVAACAQWMRASLLAQIPELSARSSVVYHAVPPLPPTATVADATRLLCLGRLVPAKGFDLALRAFGLIAARHPRVRLVIAGDGPERRSLEELAVARGIADRVELLGRVRPEETGALIAASAVVLMPSLEETFGLVALETAQQGRPIVASRVEGLAEVVVDGETGLLVPPGDVEALAGAVAALLADPDRGERLGANARAREAEHFSWERHLDAYEALYHRVARRDVG